MQSYGTTKSPKRTKHAKMRIKSAMHL